MQRRKRSCARDIDAGTYGDQVLDHLGVTPRGRAVNWCFTRGIDVVYIGARSDEGLGLFNITAPRRTVKRRFSRAFTCGEFVGCVGHGSMTPNVNDQPMSAAGARSAGLGG